MGNCAAVEHSCNKHGSGPTRSGRHMKNMDDTSDAPGARNTCRYKPSTVIFRFQKKFHVANIMAKWPGRDRGRLKSSQLGSKARTCRPGLMVAAVVCAAPETMPSASPHLRQAHSAPI